MAHIRFGSEESFLELDRQVTAMIGPQLSAGIMTQQQAQEARATAQRKSHKKVAKFYGNSKYDGSGRLVRDVGPVVDTHTDRVAMPCAIVTDPMERKELVRQRQQKNKNQARRKRSRMAT